MEKAVETVHKNGAAGYPGGSIKVKEEKKMEDRKRRMECYKMFREGDLPSGSGFIRAFEIELFRRLLRLNERFLQTPQFLLRAYDGVEQIQIFFRKLLHSLVASFQYDLPEPQDLVVHWLALSYTFCSGKDVECRRRIII